MTSRATEPRLRPATLEDDAWLFALSARLADFPVPAWRTPREIAEADHRIMREALAHPSGEVLFEIVELEAEPAGAVFATTRFDYFTGEPHAHVEVLMIEQHFEGRGLARLLMDRAESWARSRGYRRITLNVFDRNVRAQGLYAKLGYEKETVHCHKLL